MSQEQHDPFASAYVAAEYESSLYKQWEESGVFAPHTDTSKPAYSLVMPPANANGNLHVGHSLMVALEDILVRYHRMKGDRTLMIPGTDHAGFETQVVFEKYLEKQGRSRFQMTREQFYDEAMEFTLSSKGNIEDQIRLLGASCDWRTNRFTLDDAVLQRVYTTFKKMYEDGLIYRGERIVNYSVKYQTAYSDLELVHEDRNDPLYYIKYGPITVATVRPETKFGEKVIVVHPKDPRYTKYIGTKVLATIATGDVVEMEVIADDSIKPEFGTGAMTITPAHDPIDYEIAQRHNLPIIPIIGFDGRLLPIAGKFAGMKVAEARGKIAEALQELGQLERIDTTYRHSVALCYKSLQPIEPMVMPQWYIKVGPLVEPVIAAVERGEVTYVPESAKKIQLDWLRNLRDWNISRQIWWGIPINKAMPENPDIANDPDTFDTWFSSAQWPIAVLEALGDMDGRDWMAEFYPTAVMETGRDIIFFWVTRMLMMGLYLTGKVPFKTVYLHGLVMDKHGKKMSKSKGNVVSPLDLAAKYGADGVRFGLVIGSSSVDLPLPEEKMVGGRNFANKLWNMARFVRRESNGRIGGVPVAVTEADTAILAALAAACSEVTEHLEQHRMPQALQVVHQFAWATLADVYLEAAKQQRGAYGFADDSTVAVLQHVLSETLKLAHPFMPFVTEAIWQRLEFCDGWLITAPWPK